MNFEELKKLVRRFGSVVLFDDNKPELVILPYDKAGIEPETTEVEDQHEQQEIERLNNEILALREELAQKEREAEGYDDTEL
jgi:hypothetical protein